MVIPLARLAAVSALLAGAVMSMPAASAKEPGLHNPDASTPTTLYMHLIDVQDFPINTQVPDVAWTQDTTYGLTTSTLTCTPADPSGSVNLREPYHTFYGYSSPSYVEYFQQENGAPQVHPERGISYDAKLDASAPFTLYFYASVVGPAKGADGGPDPDMVPIPIPNVVVQATMRSGDDISVNDRAYNTGDILAQGRTIPATLVADQVLPGTGGADPSSTTKAVDGPGDKWFYEFAVPMTVEIPVIPRATGYNLRIDLFMDNPACTQGNDQTLMPNTLAIHTSRDLRPRMELSITNPVRVSGLHPQFVGDDLVVHAAANSVWGNYDLAEPNPEYTPDIVDGLTLDIAGPSAAASLALASLVSAWDPHYRHQEDVTLAYVWPYKADRAVPGVYTVTLRVSNDQQSAEAIAVSTFEIGRGGNRAVGCTAEGCTPSGPAGDGERDRGAPGLGPLAGLAALGAAAAVLRRRR